MSSETAWPEVLVRMVDGPGHAISLRGTIRSRNGRHQPGNFGGWAIMGDQARPQFTGNFSRARETVHHVWRTGSNVRVEDSDGHPVLISDGSRSWSFTRGDLPVEGPASAVRFEGTGTYLLDWRSATEFTKTGYSEPVGAVGHATFLGRPAWTFELAAAHLDPHTVRLVVDAETGIVLQQRYDAVDAVDEWTEFVVDEPLDNALFEWTGPFLSAEEEAARERTEQEDERARRRQWFRTHVTDQPLTTTVQVDLDVQWVHTYNDDTGAFEASLGGDHVIGGSLARRPRSSEPWNLRWGGDVHRWSTTDFDWQISLHDFTLSPDRLRQLQTRLHPGEPATHYTAG
ncbi:hypothetical protein [Rhodococcus sp. NPDC057529]|uniref:hypothetical protein n=1 Tax=Rhodococcus sp. NPDC057529 TaxID=3346158 RepID=UPI003672ACF7